MTDNDLIVAAHRGLLGYAGGAYHYNGTPLGAADCARARALVFSGHLLVWGATVKTTVAGRALANLR